MKKFRLPALFVGFMAVLVLVACPQANQASQTNNQTSQATKNSLIGEWVADEVPEVPEAPAEIKEITLSITDSHFVIKTTVDAKIRSVKDTTTTVTYKYTKDDSNIYATLEKIMLNGEEIPGEEIPDEAKEKTLSYYPKK
ncbi:MAG: hypothetical protein P1P64_07980 [Treponemataceae bacterium]